MTESKQKVDEELKQKQPLNDEMQAIAKEKIAKPKDLAKELQLAKATLKIASVAKPHTESKALVPRSMVRPAHFQLLSFEGEVLRLEKMLA